MARRPNPELHALWRDRVCRQSNSGLSVEQFCAQERCARSAFYRWKRLLDEVSPSDQCPALPGRSTFLPVSVRILKHTSDQPLPIEADLPNGIHLRIPTTNPQLACRLIRAMAAAKTNSGGPQ
jgi:hypothetical protein